MTPAERRRHSPRVRRVAAALRRVLAGAPVRVIYVQPDGWRDSRSGELADADAERLTESLLVALLPELWCNPACPDLESGS